MSDLPGIYAPVECGHCFTSLEHDEGWTCPSCGLYWPDSDPYAEVEPVFLDEDAEPCGLDNGGRERTHHGARFWDAPCSLPAGHESKHHWPLEFEQLTTKEDQE